MRFRLASAVVILAVSGFAFFFFPSLAKLAVTVVISSFCLPGVLLIWLAWNRMLGQPTDLMNPAYGMWTAGAALAFAVGFSYIFWSILFSRLLKFVGWWDPFGRPSGRPWILRGMIRVRDWWEILTRFGRQATGGWAGLLEVLSNRFRTGDVFLGRPRFKIGGGMLRPIGIATEKHMVTIAGTGAGKSTGALIPNLCLHRGSLLCVDPKGELARITARRRGTGGGGVQGMGQDVHVLDPFRITGIESASYNVFDEMARIAERDIDAPVSYAGKVAEALVEISGRDPYWDISARRLLMGLILYVFQGPAGKRNLIQVRRLLMEGDKEGFEAGVREGYIDPKKNDAFDSLLILMKHAREGPYRDTIAFAAGSLTQMGPNQLGSVLSTAQEHTAFLDLPEIRKVILTSDFLLEDLKNRPVSVYLSVPINMVSGIAGRWLRMFILLLIDMMMRVSEAPKPPILLAIDEFPSLGKLDGIEVVAPVMRSYGVRFWAVGQDIEQFRKVYPDSWGGFIGGAEAVQFMGVKHIDTVKMVVEFLGRHVIRKREGEGKLRRTVAEERNLLDANQVSQILYKERKNQIVWRGDRRPLILKVTPYFEYMPWWYYSRDARYAEKWSRRLWRWGKAKPDRLPTFDAQSSWPSLPAAPPAGPLEKPPQLIAPGNGDWADKILAKPPSNLMNLYGSRDAFWREIETMENEITSVKKPPAPSRQNRRLPQEVLEVLNPPPVAGGDEPDPVEELDAMVGLDSVKTQVKKTLSLIKLGQARDAAGLPRLEVTHHLVFTGNPGTGKTTVARIIGRIYKIMGLLKSGHLVEVDRGDLVAGYTGQTAPQVKEVIERATDGVLFIDEAYSLAASQGGKDTYGAEAISTLIKLMEDRRGRLVVIAAGYRAEMAHFINSNPGLASRFKTFIDFPDYTPTELMEILQNICASAGCQMSLDAMRKAAALMMKIDQGKGFGNGRAVRNIFEECVARQAHRLATRGEYGAVDLTMIEADDVPTLEDLRM